MRSPVVNRWRDAARVAGAHGADEWDHGCAPHRRNDYGLVVDTGIGAGTKVGMRVPKFRAGIRA